MGLFVSRDFGEDLLEEKSKYRLFLGGWGRWLQMTVVNALPTEWYVILCM